jgi:hypothetical protein
MTYNYFEPYFINNTCFLGGLQGQYAARLILSRPTKPILEPSRRLVVKAGERSGVSQKALTMRTKVLGFARRAAEY